MKRLVAILGTADTKREELIFLKQLIAKEGFSPFLIDVGIFPLPSRTQEDVDIVKEIDVNNEQVSIRGGTDYSKLRHDKTRDAIMTIMGNGARSILEDLLGQKNLAGVIAIGGNQGSAIAAMAMRSLPFGMPKILVSTVASGNIRPFVGHQDIMVVFSVSDMIGSLNSISEIVLRNAAGALTGMIRQFESIGTDEPTEKSEAHGHTARPVMKKSGRTVAISALGNTQAAVEYLVERLKSEKIHPVAFHASGAGGSAMEELIAEGYFDGLIDLTPHELSEEVMGQGIYQPTRPERMSEASKKGIPQAVSTGGLEYVCFGPSSTIPREMRDHVCYMHNPYNANVALTSKELEKVASVMASRLNSSSGQVTVLIPLKGWSVYGSPDGPFHNPEVYRSFIEIFKQSLKPSIFYEEVDTTINDHKFSKKLADKFLDIFI